ncbi:MAG TPA: hypothetical protein VHE30_22715 [Polyangiaceae bacterium]|nr:hypothetical protein [Polyangiaceae bacterium]
MLPRNSKSTRSVAATAKAVSFVPFLLGLLGLVAACSRKTPEPESRPEVTRTAPSAPPVASTPPKRLAPKLVWPDPPGWTRGEPGPMRVATYRVPGPKEQDAEMSVSHFPGGSGGGIEANFDRWIGQFEGRHAEPVKSQRTQGIMPANVLEIAHGTFRPMQGEPKPGQALVGAIVEAPDGPWFFKLTGPEKTVAKAKPAFFEMLDAVGMQAE